MAPKLHSMNAPEYCPHCGAEVPDSARACPECGSDEQTGWSDRAHAARLGLPDDAFDYEEFVERELEGQPPRRRRWHWLWWPVALATATALILGYLGF